MKRAVSLAACAALMALSGCMGTTQGETSARFASTPSAGLMAVGSEASPLIAGLQARQSLLVDGTSYHRVADAVMAANARTSEVELRAAVLRAEAASKNWLPQIGPELSLTSMGDFVASLLIEQVIFDNGRKKAERAFAAADVEVAAAALSQNSNERVLAALNLYLTAEKARARAAISGQAAADMADFMRIMEARVAGGVSDMSDEQVLRLKLAEARETFKADLETAQAAIAELNAMSAFPLDDLRGVSEVPGMSADAVPLAVVKAEAEKGREIASAKMERAGMLPGLTAGGRVSKDQNNLGLTVAADQLFGLGTAAGLKAVDAQGALAEARVQQAQEDSDRVIARLEQELVAQARQDGRTGTLAGQARASYRTFQDQYEAGQRQVMDVVSVYETMVARQLDHVVVRYDAALTRLKIAGHYGVLVSGDAV